MADELLFDGNSEDATADIKRLVIEFASTLPADVWPNSYMANEVKGRWQYLTDLDGRKSGRIVLEVTGDFLMTDEERQARLSDTPESIQTWDGNNWVATHPGVVGRAFNWKSLGEIEILRMNERRSRIINLMNSLGSDVWQYVSNELSRMGLLVSLSTSTTTTEQTLSAAATPQPSGINFSNINVGGNFTANLSDVAGGNQNTTTTSTTITQQTSPAAASADLVSTTSTDDKPFDREIRQYDSFLFFTSPDGFAQWGDGYMASIGENRIYPSLERIYEDDEFYEYGNRRWVYVYSGCVISFIMKVEEPEKLRITPVVKASAVDIDKCEKHIAIVVRAAKSKFCGTERAAAATPHTQRIQHLQVQLQEHLDLLHKYEQQESVEDDPRRLKKIQQNIAREKEAIKRKQNELTELSHPDKLP